MTTPPPSSTPPPIQKSWNLFNPGGDPSVLRACAQAWRDMASQLKATVEAQDTQVTRTETAWTGAAADAFHAHWNRTRTQVEDALPQFETVAEQLDTTAEAIAKANAAVHHVVEELAATAAIGIGLSVLTAGFSDLFAAGAASAEVAEATGEVTRLGQLLLRVSRMMQEVKDAMEDSRLLKISVELGTSFGKNFASNTVGNVAGQAAAGQPITWGSDIQDAAVAGAVGTGLGAGGGALSGKASGRIADALAGDHIIGGAVNGVVTSAAGQAAADGVDMWEGSKTSTNLWQDTLTSGLTGGLAGGVTGGAHDFVDGGGKHRSDDSPNFRAPAEIGLNGAMYGAGGAIENDLTAATPTLDTHPGQNLPKSGPAKNLPS
jgi:WXG100 family type VII secretion target